MTNKKVTNIFILDDTHFDREMIKKFLAEFVFLKYEKKFRIIESTSIKDANERLRSLENSVDLFILDGTLNPGHGYDLIPVIKESSPNAKIVMCSGNTELNRTGMDEGADMEIPKGEIGIGKSFTVQESYARKLRGLLVHY